MTKETLPDPSCDPATAELLSWLATMYLAVRLLPDGSIACLQELITTRGILLGCTRGGWSARFCFADRGLAIRRFHGLQSEDDVPQGFVARRPELRNADGNYIGVALP